MAGPLLRLKGEVANTSMSFSSASVTLIECVYTWMDKANLDTSDFETIKTLTESNVCAIDCIATQKLFATKRLLPDTSNDSVHLKSAVTASCEASIDKTINAVKMITDVTFALKTAFPLYLQTRWRQ